MGVKVEAGGDRSLVRDVSCSSSDSIIDDGLSEFRFNSYVLYVFIPFAG